MGTKNEKLIFSKFFNVSRETMHTLQSFENLILTQLNNVNIIGKSTEDKIWLRHFSDSAKLFKHIEELTLKDAKKTFSIVDVGTGAGFPGMVLAILNKEKRLNIKFTLVESTSKKFNFLIQTSRKLKLKVNINNKRAELLDDCFDIILARAVAPLSKLMNLTWNLAKKKTVFMFPKGKNWEKETTELKKKWYFQLNVVKNNREFDESGGVTLIFSKVKRKL